MRRRYTKTQKAEAVAAAVVEGQTAAAERRGIPLTTLNQWFNSPEYVELRSKTNQDVADQFWAVIQLGLQRVQELIPVAEDLAKVSTAVGILYDKHALLTGSATSRSEHRDLPDPDDAGLDALEQALLAGRTAPTLVGVELQRNGTGANGKH